jgi:ketosteroid isomerase-like protein
MGNAHFLIREYYNAFNERRLEDAADLFTQDAVIQHRPDGSLLRGPEGYLESAHATVAIFPDIQIQILHVEQRGDTIVEIDLSATGTHRGDWNMGTLGVLKADNATKIVRHREMLEIRGGKITYSSITYDIKDFVAKDGGARDA